jgi:hypothetical protein
LNQNPAIVSFSEPDVFRQLVLLRTAGQSNHAEVAALLYDALLIMCANAQQRGFWPRILKQGWWALRIASARA